MIGAYELEETVTLPDDADTVEVYGCRFPLQYRTGNLLNRWRTPPADPLVLRLLKPDTHKEATTVSRILYEQRGIHQANFHFVKTYLRKRREELLPRRRRDWTADQRKRYRAGEYDDELREIAEARLANREAWYSLLPRYKEARKKVSAWIEELHAKEAAERKERERREREEEAERKRKAERAAEEKRSRDIAAAMEKQRLKREEQEQEATGRREAHLARVAEKVELETRQKRVLEDYLIFFRMPKDKQDHAKMRALIEEYNELSEQLQSLRDDA